MDSLFNSWKTVMEMISDRGFDVGEKYIYACDACRKYRSIEPECDCFSKFVKWVGDDKIEARKEMSVVFCKGSKKIITFWIFQFGVSDVQKIFEQMEEQEVSHAVVIYGNKVTSTASKAIKQLVVQKKIIESFHENELQYNVTKSEWVPRHIICSKDKKEEILKMYNVKKEEIPFIKSTDPVVKYLGAVRGQLIKIVRESESVEYVTTAKEKKDLYDISYRIVVP